MSKVFFDHLVIREEITAELDLHAIDPEEREELIQLVDEILHHHVLNVILNHLPKEHHLDFAKRLHEAPHDPGILEYVKTKVTIDIEDELKKHAAKIKKDILADIKKSKGSSHSS